MTEKDDLRRAMRAERRDHVAALPGATRALLFRHPPRPVLDRIAPDAAIGLYHAGPDEAPTGHYARWFAEAGHRLVLPRFAVRDEAMGFAEWNDPFGESDLEPGPFGVAQPAAGASKVEPDVLFVPLLGFTPAGDRLGQGGGHYDRWLAAHPGTLAIGLGWDAQCRDTLPVEPHDAVLALVVTPTRTYECRP